jgi:transposase
VTFIFPCTRQFRSRHVGSTPLLLSSAWGALVVMEATGHYWRNLFACICARGFRCEVLNPLRIRRFAQEDFRYASAKALREADPGQLGRLRYSSRGIVGAARAAALIAQANASVARHHSSAYDAAVRTYCADMDSLRQSLKVVNGEINRALAGHVLALLLTSIEGLGARYNRKLWMRG